MSTDPSSLLTRHGPFRGLSVHQIDAMSSLWAVRSFTEAEVIWQEDGDGDELGIVVEGELAAFVRGRQVGRILRGEVVGEANTFFEGQRAAAVVGVGPGQLVVLSRAGLRELRTSHDRCYDVLLDHALQAMARRVQHVNRRIASLESGGARPARQDTSPGLSRLMARWRGGNEQSPPDVIPLLRKLPRLDSAPPGTLTAIRAAMNPVQIGKGHALCHEGDPGDGAMLLVSGEIEVFRNVWGGALTRLAALKPGALMGTGSLILKERRNASLIASEDVWVFEMSRERFLALVGPPRRVLSEAVLVALRAQLSGANTIVATLERRAGEADIVGVLGQAAVGLAAFDGRALVHDVWALYDV